ncbi:MAG: response regulator transcription factor [Planctomycetaceae bacterium]|nr:response regulator transcription factor [Planctomycetaceae bacterium]
MTRAIVYLVEDDAAVRSSLVRILELEGYHVEAFAAPAELLAQYDPAKPGCLVLDLRLPEMSGIELRQRLVDQGCRHPFIIITGHGEVRDATHSMRMGAVDFIEKPLDRKILLARVSEAVTTDLQRRLAAEQHELFRARLEALTPREREVLQLVVAGRLSKQIASELKIAIKTVEVHRSNIVRKMQIDNVIQLVRLYTEYTGTCDSN